MYDLINWLFKSLKAHIVLYLEKESGSDIETWSVNRLLKKGTSLWKKYAENVRQKLVPDPFLVLANIQNSQYLEN